MKQGKKGLSADSDGKDKGLTNIEGMLAKIDIKVKEVFSGIIGKNIDISSKETLEILNVSGYYF